MEKGMYESSLHVKKLVYKAATVGWSVFRMVLLIGLSFVLIYPLIYMLAMAFRPLEEVYDPSVVWVSKSLTMENMTKAIEGLDYWKSLVTSVLVNVVSSLLQVAACAVTGYGFARFEFRGKKLLFGIVLFSILVPAQVVTTPSLMDFKNFDFFGIGSLIGLIVGHPLTVNLLDTPLTFYLPAILGAGLKSGLFIFLFRQFFRGMPKELEDASAIDGCGFVKCFLRIMVPNAAPAFLTSVILSIVWYWNDYYLGSMYMKNLKTVTCALVRLKDMSIIINGENTINPYEIITMMQAGCLLTILPILIMYLILQKYFVQSAERSGIVG